MSHKYPKLGAVAGSFSPRFHLLSAIARGTGDKKNPTNHKIATRSDKGTAKSRANENTVSATDISSKPSA
jgi:hypothetical protein